MAALDIKPFYSGRMAYDITAPDGSKYVFVPKEFAEKGFVQDGQQWFEPALMREGAFSTAAAFSLPSAEGITDAAKSLYSNPTEGYVWKAEDFSKINDDDFAFTSYTINENSPPITGLGSKEGQVVYTTTGKPGSVYGWVDPGYEQNKVLHHQAPATKSGGLFGNNFISDAFEGVGNFLLEAGPIVPLALNAMLPGLGTAVAVGTQLGQGNVEGALTNFAVQNALSGALPSTGSAIGDAALQSGTTAALTGGNPLEAAVLGGANAGLAGSLQGTGSTAPDLYDFEPNSFPDTTAPDYDFKADYSLTSGVPTPSEGFQAPPMTGTVFNEDGSVNYALSVPAQNMGLQYTGIPSLPEMGGGQGLVANVPGGTVSQTGFIPTNPNVVLGDPESFINKEGGTGRASDVDYGKILEALLAAGAGAAGVQAMQGQGQPTPMPAFQPANTMPVYDEAYFNAVQQNYNALAPQGLMADVATPLRQWYVPETSIVDRLFGGNP